MNTYDMALIGPLSLDINVEPDGTEIREIGGAVTYSPYAAVVGGAAEAIAFAKANLEEVDVEAHLHDFSGRLVPLNAAKTTSIRNEYRDISHETRDSFVISQTEPFRLTELGDVEARIFHLAGLIYGDFSSDFIRQIAAKGKLAIDAQCLLRHADFETGDLYFADWDEKLDLLPLVDFLKVDAKEAEILTGSTCRETAAKQLYAWGAREVFISYHTEMTVYDGKTLFTCAYKPASTEGRTGRGDTVFAAYLARRLTHDISDSLLFATALVALKISKRGPFRGSEADVLAEIENKNMHVQEETI